MPNIRVTCPACKSELEIDASFEGQEVECGNCLEVFKAKGPGASGSSRGGGKIPGAGASSAGGSGRSKPASRAAKKRRRDDDDDDYEHDRRRDDDDDDDYAPPPPRRRSDGAGGLAVTSLVLGITAFIPGCCCVYLGGPLALGAVITGAIGMGDPNGRGMAIAGVALGGVWMALMVVLFVIGVGMNFANPNQFR